MHLKSRMILLAALGLALLPALAARAEDTADQKALRARRAAMLKAVNAHDVKAVKAFIDPSFTTKTKDGQTITYEQAMQALDQVFQTVKDFQESDKIEKVEVDGDAGKITLTETVTFTDPMGKKQSQTERDRELWTRKNGRWMLTGEEQL
jgi:ketosteroid isomerase-like protein